MTDAINNYAQGMYSKYRWYDLLNTKVDTRDGDEIAMDFIERTGISYRQE